MAGADAFPVGVRHFVCTDAGRIDRQEKRSRRFMVSAFYPALPNEKAVTVSAADVMAPAVNEGLEALARWHKVSCPDAAGRARALRFKAWQDLEPATAQGPYPVLICSAPGEGSRFAMAELCILLAQQGFVVLSVDHPHDAKVVVYPDGTICDTPLENESHMLMRILDVVCLVELLKSAARPTFLEGLLDLARLGAFGHSRGGATAVASAFWSTDIRAGINLDGYLFGFEPKQFCGLEFYEDDFRQRVGRQEKPILRVLGVPATARDLSPFSFEAEAKVFAGPFVHLKLPKWAHADFSCDSLSRIVKNENVDESGARAGMLAQIVRPFFARMLSDPADLGWLAEIQTRFPDGQIGVKPFGVPPG